MAVTPQAMRDFASECMRWSEETGDASQRDLMTRIAKSWMSVASSLERRADEGRLLDGDLRRKLD
jgi:hypothetical protein